MKKYIPSLLVPITAFSLMLSAVAPVSAQTETASPLCYTFTKNLGEGRPISSADAQALTVALIKAGVWNQESPITTYNDTVASAVSGFQEKYAAQILTPNGLSYGTGFVGASTRAQLNSLYGGCSSSGGNVGGNPQPTQCPAGYTCTPIGQNPAPVCPPGYTCVPVGSTPSNPTSSGASTVSLTLDPSSPLTGQTNQTLAVPVLVFDLNPQNGVAALTRITANIATSGSGSVTTAYLYANGSLLATAPVQNGVASFTNVFGQMSANTYQAYTIKVDTANANGLTIAASINTASGYGIVNATGVNMTLTGSATGYPIMIGGSPNTPITSPVSPISTATESASLTLDPSSPTAGLAYPNNSSVPVLVFDLNSNTLADLQTLAVQLSTSGSGSVTMAYLSQAGKNIATTTVSGNTIQFNQISVTPMNANTYYPFTVKVDTANPQNLMMTASVNQGNARVVDSTGVFINVNGQATGYPIIVGNTHMTSL